MASRTPLVLVSGQIQQIQAGDILAPASLGTGTPSTKTFLRGDGVWTTQLVTNVSGGGMTIRQQSNDTAAVFWGSFKDRSGGAISANDLISQNSRYVYVGATNTFVEVVAEIVQESGAVSDSSTGAGGRVYWATRKVGGDITARFVIENNGDLVTCGAAAASEMSTSATEGFLYLPTMNGAPSGVPGSRTGGAAVAIDRVNNALAFYAGGAWRKAYSGLDVQTFTASGTWNKPTNAKFVVAFMIAGGGGGGGARIGAAGTLRGGGGGGGGSRIAFSFFNAGWLGSSESVTVGAGGLGDDTTANSTDGNAGQNGGSTIFGDVTLPGGGGGGGGTSAAGGSAGTAGAAPDGFSLSLTSVAGTAGSNGAANATDATDLTTIAPGAGGGGGGVSSGNVSRNGGSGSSTLTETGGVGGTANVSGGTDGGDSTSSIGEGGAGGGGAGGFNVGGGLNATAGDGGNFGGGGGGAGAGTNGTPTGSTAAGDGGPGLLIVFTFCSGG